MMKRAFDICASTLGLLITWPLLVIISVLIKLDSRGPVIFSQVRVGKGFCPFRIYKFRTMVEEAPGQGLPLTSWAGCPCDEGGPNLAEVQT